MTDLLFPNAGTWDVDPPPEYPRRPLGWYACRALARQTECLRPPRRRRTREG
ncbi:hypothetical protein [Glycomyces tarimensis]